MILFFASATISLSCPFVHIACGSPCRQRLFRFLRWLPRRPRLILAIGRLRGRVIRDHHVQL